MPQKSKGNDGYKRLTDSLTSGRIGSFYIFFGDERYLLENSLGELRRRLCPNGLNGFNYKRFEGKSISIKEIDDAINTLPAFAERTLVEVHDFDIFKCEEKPRLSEILSDLPDYVCVVFVYNIVPYKPDGRQKINSEILKFADVIEFPIQDKDKLVNWIKRHISTAGKKISTSDAEYLAFITGGFMSSLYGEIEKAAAFAKGENVTRTDIDSVVTPVLDTVAYKLTDALSRRDNAAAMRILDELFQMREPPHKLLYSISLKMRQLLAARICLENGLDKFALMDICGIKHEFQARTLLDTARITTLGERRDAVLTCSEAAHELNMSADPEQSLIELITKLSFNYRKIKQ